METSRSETPPAVHSEVEEVPQSSVSPADESVPPQEIDEDPPSVLAEDEDPKQSWAAESTNSPVSDVSSGYISTSVSSATLSESLILNESEMGKSTEAEPEAISEVLSPEDQTPLQPASLDHGEQTSTDVQRASEEHGRVSPPAENFEGITNPSNPFASSKSSEPSLPPPQPPANIHPSKPEEHRKSLSASTGNPFHIQRVKTSGLKSFGGVLHEDAKDRDSDSLSTLSLSQETLEILSDSEEGLDAPLPDWLKEGEYVTVGTNKTGTVRYVGPTDFAKGVWVGVELDVPAGTQFAFL